MFAAPCHYVIIRARLEGTYVQVVVQHLNVRSAKRDALTSFCEEKRRPNALELENRRGPHPSMHANPQNATEVSWSTAHLLARATCNFTSRSIFRTHFSSKLRSVNRFADSRARRRIASISCGGSVSALWKPSAYCSSVEAWKPVLALAGLFPMQKPRTGMSTYQ